MPDVRLVIFDTSHLDGLRALLDDPQVLRYTRVPEPVPDGFAETWLGAYEAGRRDGTREGFALIGSDGEFLRVGAAPHIEEDTATAELGYVEGVLRSRHVKPGRREDTELWSRLVTDS